MTDYREALAVIKSELKKLPLSEEKVSLTGITGRILAEDIYADTNLPPFNNSAMDGYAVVFNQNIRRWEIEGVIPAGHYKEFTASENSAVEIMTGSKIPPGYDTVIAAEDIILMNGFIELKGSSVYKKGIYIRHTGEDLSKGEILVKRNTLITFKEAAAIATAGRKEVLVYKPFKAGIITTGDELIDINELPSGDKIRASNMYALTAALKEMNIEAINYGIVKDNSGEIRNVISSALQSEINILITTGGVSAGKYDIVKDALIAEGAELKFHKVNIKPGKPLLFCTAGSGSSFKLVFGLPGNPVSALTGFLLFVRHPIYSLLGIAKHREVPAVLGSNIIKEDSKLHFLRGSLTREKNHFVVYADEKQSSGNISQLASSDCLIMIEEDTRNPKKGEMVNCLLI